MIDGSLGGWSRPERQLERSLLIDGSLCEGSGLALPVDARCERSSVDDRRFPRSMVSGRASVLLLTPVRTLILR